MQSKETILHDQFKLYYKGSYQGYHADTKEKCEAVRDKYVKHKGWDLNQFEITGGHTVRLFSLAI